MGLLPVHCRRASLPSLLPLTSLPSPTSLPPFPLPPPFPETPRSFFGLYYGVGPGISGLAGGIIYEKMGMRCARGCHLGRGRWGALWVGRAAPLFPSALNHTSPLCSSPLSTPRSFVFIIFSCVLAAGWALIALALRCGARLRVAPLPPAGCLLLLPAVPCFKAAPIGLVSIQVGHPRRAHGAARGGAGGGALSSGSQLATAAVDSLSRECESTSFESSF